MYEQVRVRASELPHRFSGAPFGSAEWLIQQEVRYGGLVTDVPRNRVSPLDQRSQAELAFGGMTGGDRMLHHGYASTYARCLAPFFGATNLTLAEFGILNGTGLAIWCDLFPAARVIGFDIDLGHFNANRASLVMRGAFKYNRPEVHEYDQLVDGHQRLEQILNSTMLDIVIDDGLHTAESIITTWRSTKPFLSQRFVYIIEDYPQLLDACRGEFEPYDCRSLGMLTVVSQGPWGSE